MLSCKVGFDERIVLSSMVKKVFRLTDFGILDKVEKKKLPSGSPS
ncbi:hypothetical protein pah_c207o005 [Parachlamydia acanthamoebae str. Hall's coccus]|nr:hypothetical protein pah_c207o005 [Parachlamydia acanthamoebae str. Hall's coccus]